jgi:hypothetical protein
LEQRMTWQAQYNLHYGFTGLSTGIYFDNTPPEQGFEVLRNVHSRPYEQRGASYISNDEKKRGNGSN